MGGQVVNGQQERGVAVARGWPVMASPGATGAKWRVACIGAETRLYTRFPWQEMRARMLTFRGEVG